jgi:Family of unknown function (DUF6530)
MKIPTELKHKPVIVVEDYKNIDGKSAYKSDVEGLSMGLAQWNERGILDISAKVWRHTGQKWSRQSEELPIHRILDLAILSCKTKQYFMEVYKNTELYDKKAPTLARIGLQGDAMTVKICTENKMIDKDIQLFYDQLSQDDELISERLRTLSGILSEMGY